MRYNFAWNIFWLFIFMSVSISCLLFAVVNIMIYLQKKNLPPYFLLGCEIWFLIWGRNTNLNSKIKFLKKNPTRCNNVSNFFIQYLHEAQHVSGDTPPIIRRLKLHWQPLFFYTRKVVGRVVGGRCQAQCAWRHCACQGPPASRPKTFRV